MTARVVVVGASGNVGHATLRHLREGGADIIGVARRRPADGGDVSWVSLDIGAADAGERLAEVCRGADAVVHLAWEIQPGRNIDQQRRTNVVGSQHVIDAVLTAGVPALIYASSIGAYSAGPKDRPVDENWPTDGIPTSTYARHKAEVERMLDAVERRDPRPRIVRFRPGLVFQREAASEIARYFLGPYIPLSALRRRFIPVIPAFDRLVFQVVHADDLGRAMAMAVTDSSAQGAYNIAADPVLDARRLAATLHAKTVPVPLAALRGAADLAFRGRLIPIDAGWVDMAAAVPVMSTERVKTDLGWQPRITSEQALLDLLAGMSEGRGAPTDPLAPAPSVAGRVAEAVRATVEGGPGSRNP